MHRVELDRWRHAHAFEHARTAHSERRTRWVVGLTFVMMVVEIIAGHRYRSMALLADGWHMGTHAAALGVAALAYFFARRYARDARFSFGTGKVGALGGFASAIGLAVVALGVGAESVARLAVPAAIRFDEAIAVAGVGLVVNLVSAVLLHEHEHEHEHEQHRDHNLRGAYLHVLADALTSVLAIVALLAGRLLGWNWMDATMGIVGSLVIARWSFSLLRDTGAVLLDAEVPAARRASIVAALEADADNRVADLHVWRVGPEHLAAIVSVVSHEPRDPSHYKALLGRFPDLAHVTVEVNACSGERCDAFSASRTDRAL